MSGILITQQSIARASLMIHRQLLCNVSVVRLQHGVARSDGEGAALFQPFNHLMAAEWDRAHGVIVSELHVVQWRVMHVTPAIAIGDVILSASWINTPHITPQLQSPCRVIQTHDFTFVRGP